MARDTFAVPATGAGVERVFSKSGRVASWTRARLDHKMITESMFYKDMLYRHGELEGLNRGGEFMRQLRMEMNKKTTMKMEK